MSPRAPSLLSASALAVALVFMAGCASKTKKTTTETTDKVVVESSLGQVTPPKGPDSSGSNLAGGDGSGKGGAGDGSGMNIVKPAAADSGEWPIRGIVYFDFDKYDIKPEYREVVETNARNLRNSPATKSKIEGHTDSVGSSEYNLALGQRRAESVRKAMVILGVQETQLEAVSYGMERPAVQGNDAGVRAKNRRAEIRYR